MSYREHMHAVAIAMLTMVSLNYLTLQSTVLKLIFVLNNCNYLTWLFICS